MAFGAAGSDTATQKPGQFQVLRSEARVQMLPLTINKCQISNTVSAFKLEEVSAYIFFFKMYKINFQGKNYYSFTGTPSLIERIGQLICGED